MGQWSRRIPLRFRISGRLIAAWGRAVCRHRSSCKHAHTAVMVTLWAASALLGHPAFAFSPDEFWDGWPLRERFELRVAWEEVDARGERVLGFRVQSKRGGPERDLYFDGEGRLQTPVMLRSRGIHAKKWDPGAVRAAARMVPARPERPKLEPVALGWRVSAEELALEPLDVGLLMLEDAERAAAGDKGGLRIGVVRPVEPAVRVSGNTASAGQWRTLTGGIRVWSMDLTSPGATGMRVHLEALNLPPGAFIVVYDPDKPGQAFGPYTSSGEGSAGVWTAMCFSDTVRIECQVLPGADTSGLTLAIREAVHIYAELDDIAFKQAGACNLDVSCFPGLDGVSRGVAGIASISSPNVLWCTGSLLADRNEPGVNPFFLTAFHCVSIQTGTPRSASQVELFWLFQSDACNGTVPTLASVPRTSAGLDFKAGSPVGSGTDFSLLQLREPPPPGTMQLGWSTLPHFPGASVTGIHHPRGTFKRASFGTITDEGSPRTGTRLNRPIERFHEILWSQGTTEPGSSGSPILHATTLEIVGQLWGGHAACAFPEEPDYYGRFDVSYPLVQAFLDPKSMFLPEDIDQSGSVDSQDIQIVINAVLMGERGPDHPADVNGDGRIDAVDIQRVINAALAGM